MAAVDGGEKQAGPGPRGFRAADAAQDPESAWLALLAVGGLVYESDVGSGRMVVLCGAEELTGLRGDELEAQGGWWERVHPEDRDAARARAAAQLDGGAALVVNEYRVRQRDGRWLECLDRARVVRDERGRAVRVVGCIVDVTAQRGLERACAAAEAGLREADRRKDELLALLAHELRNPLAPIEHAVDLLRARGSAADIARARDIIGRQVRHLRRRIDDLLDASRLVGGRFELQRAPVALAALVEQAIEVVAPLVEARGHQLARALPDAPVWIDGDATRLVQALANVLENAVQYTRPGGHLRIGAVLDGGRARLSVRDDGVGMTRAELARAFEPFVQVGRPGERPPGGLGIGLTLARQLVEAHGGAVAITSEGAERGTEVTLTLDTTAAPAADAAAEEPAGTSGLTVLVVDDNADAAELLAELLVMRGHQVRIALDGPAALARAREQVPEVVVLDIGLPGASGFEVARQLRAFAGSAPFIVALTGYGQERDRRLARESGFDDYLTKPMAFDVLERVLEKAASRRR